MCFDLWMAGMETTSNTLYWGVLYVLLYEDVQKSMHDELDREVGSDRLITLADRSRLHYINAVISVSELASTQLSNHPYFQEVQRVANLLVLNVFHETTTEVVIDGYRIPSKTLFLPQISSVMYDERVRWYHTSSYSHDISTSECQS